jgi:hypothetical protein
MQKRSNGRRELACNAIKLHLAPAPSEGPDLDLPYA